MAVSHPSIVRVAVSDPSIVRVAVSDPTWSEWLSLIPALSVAVSDPGHLSVHGDMDSTLLRCVSIIILLTLPSMSKER